MKKLKQGLAAALAAALLCTSLPLSAQAASFSDVPEDAWYRSSVSELADKGILSGTGGSTFSPQNSLTRAQFATMLAKAVLTGEDLQQYDFEGSFKDVKQDYWGNKYINWAQEVGIVSGYEDGTFQPGKAVTRQEMATMVVNFSRITCRRMQEVNAAVSFDDADEISNYAKSSVQKCQLAGVINGYKDNTFRPKKTANRAEAAVLVAGFLKTCLPSQEYTVICKRVSGVPIRAVIFDSKKYAPQLVTGGDIADGKESAYSMVSRTSPMFGVNGSFFDMNNFQALGTIIKDGRVITTFENFAPNKSSFTVDAAGKISIQHFSTRHSVTLHTFTPEGEETDLVLADLPVNRWPSSATDATRILYTKDWGDSLGYPPRDAVTIDEDGTVLAVTHYPNDVEIPEKGYVLAQRARREYEGPFFDTVKVGDVLKVERVYEGLTCGEPVISLGAGPQIVMGGEVYGNLDTYHAEGLTAGSITSYTHLAPCIGICSDGKIVLATYYGTLSQAARAMVALGCDEAINLDGGGSTNLYADGFWLRGPQGRLLNNMLVFKKSSGGN